MNTFRKILFIFAHGCLLFAFSERFFWAFRREEDTFANLFMGIISYTFLAYIFLFLVWKYNIRTFSRLLLASFAYAFLAEAVLSGMLYSPLALMVFFVAIPWHALIAIMLGWYLLPRLMTSLSWLQLAGRMSLIGLFFALWAPIWFNLPGGDTYTPSNFISHVIVTTLLILFSYILAQTSKGVTPITYNAKEGWVLLTLSILITFFPLLYKSPLVISVPINLLLVCIFAFLLSRPTQSTGENMEGAPLELPTLKTTRLLTLFFIPLSASFIFVILFQFKKSFNSLTLLLILSIVLSVSWYYKRRKNLARINSAS